MKITDLLKVEGIDLKGQAGSKKEIIEKMVGLMGKTGALNDEKLFQAAVLKREEEGTTGIGEGIAIPHGKTVAVNEPGLAAMVVKEGTDFEALDNEAVYLLFMIAAPEAADNLHLEVLSRLSTILMDPDFRQKLIEATDEKEFLTLIDKKEHEKFADEAQKETGKGYQILAVTACPTGIAHTYMAAESLENTAKEMGISIKVETDGSGGIKNQLTAEDIKNADCIIVTADKNVELNRFNGKPVIIRKVADGIHKPKELLELALSQKVPVYQGEAQQFENATQEKESIGRKIYKDLMNGVSHMLPFVIGGGILIALAFLFDDYTIDPANFGSNTPLAAFLMTVGGTAFGFMMPVLAGYIAMSIGDRPA